MAQGSGIDFHPRNGDVRMSAQMRKVFPIGLEFFFRNESFVAEHTVKCLRTMSFAQNESVAFRHFRLLGIHVQNTIVKYCQHIQHRQIPPCVTCFARMDEIDKIQSELFTFLL